MTSNDTDPTMTAGTHAPIRRVRSVLGLPILLLATAGLTAACSAPDAPAGPGAADPLLVGAQHSARAPDRLLERPDLQRLVDAQTARDPAPLIEALGAPDPAVRARAAYALASVQAPEAAPILIRLLDDPDPRVRADAAFALGRLAPSDSLAAPLRDRLDAEGDAAVRAELLDAMGYVAEDGVAAGLAAWDAPDDDRVSANLALARIALRGVGGDAVWRRLADDFRHADPEVRFVSAWPFTRSDDIPDWFEYRRELRRALGTMDFDDPSAWIYVDGAGRQTDVFVRPLLERWLRHGIDWRARWAAAGSLLTLKSDDGWLQLVESLDDPNPHVRLAAVTAMNEEAWLPGIAEVVKRRVARNPDDPTTNGPLVAHLATMDDTLYVAEWMEGHDWSDVPRSRAALDVASKIGSSHAIRWLREGSVAPDPGIRSAALTALLERWDLSRSRPEAHPVFLEAFSAILRGPDDRASARAAAALSDSALLASGAVGVLREYWAERAPDASPLRARAVLAALAEDPDSSSVGILRSATTDPRPEVARTAARLLEERTGEVSILPPGAPPSAPERPSPDWDRLRDLGEHPRLVLETERGAVVLELSTSDAPVTVQEITRLAEEGRYDGTPFHRVVSNFVVQGGDVSAGDGTGGPGFRMRSELTRTRYLRGVLGMARGPALDSEGSQFFVTHSPQHHLDGEYGAFGRVVEGMGVIDAIRPWDVLLRAYVVPDTGGSPGR